MLSRDGIRRAALAIIRKSWQNQRQRNSLIICNHRSTSSWTKDSYYQKNDLKKDVDKVLSLSIGSLNEEGWENVEYLLRKCCREEGSVKLSFDLLDRIANEEEDPDFTPSFNPLNSAIFNWKNQYLNNPQTSESPRDIVERLGKWREQSQCLQPDAKTYTMIIEASKHDKEGVFFAESLLKWMLNESKKNILIQPTTVTFAALMNAWATSGRPESSNKIEELIHQMKELHESGWPDLSPTTAVYNILLNSLARAGNVEQAEGVLQNMLSEATPVEPDRISFTTLLKAYSTWDHSEAFGRAQMLLSQMHELYEGGYESAKPNVISYTVVMNLCAKQGKGQHAEELLKRLIEIHAETNDSDFMADITTYNTVLLAWAKSNQPDRADQFLRFMYEGSEVQPNERSFNTILSAWAKVGASEKAEEILTRMHEFYIDGELDTRPTVVAYNTVLDSWARSKNRNAWKRCINILDHMMELTDAGETAVKPNERTWNTVLNCFANSGKTKLAEEYIQKFMQASKESKVHGKPNVRTWNTLLASCLKKRDVQTAKRFWKAMKDSGVKADVVSYNTLLNCYARSSKPGRYVKDMEKTFRQMNQDQSVKPNRISYLALINFWIGMGKVEKAESILKDMCRNHAINGMLEPDRDLFHNVLTAWSDKSSPRKAEALLFMMMELNERHGFDISPTVETYNRLLNAWAKSKETSAGERADSILRQMESFSLAAGHDSVSPDIISYNSVLNAWANSGDATAVTRIEHLILEMIMKGNPKLTPNIVSYGTWLKAIETSNEENKGDRANEVLKTMKIHNLRPTDFIQRKVKSLMNPLA